MMKQTVCPNCGGLLRAESHGWICQKCRGFISLQDGKFYEYVEKPFLPPMTNADRIRAMSDEELAKILNAFTEYFQECNRSIADVNCEDCELNELCSLGEGKALKWLQQPAEG